MSTSIPFQSGPRDPNRRPFPTRGVPDGWRDPWDADPFDAVLSALRQRNALRRQVTESGVRLELVAQARSDGHWEAHVLTGDAPAARWPSTNGPTVTVALDALEAELREVLGGADVTPDAER
jgi:hypothetical protein